MSAHDRLMDAWAVTWRLAAVAFVVAAIYSLAALFVQHGIAFAFPSLPPMRFAQALVATMTLTAALAPFAFLINFLTPSR